MRTKSRTWTRTPSKVAVPSLMLVLLQCQTDYLLSFISGVCCAEPPAEQYLCSFSLFELYVLSRYLNSLVCTVVLVCLTIVLLVVGTTARIFVFLLYLIRSY